MNENYEMDSGMDDTSAFDSDFNVDADYKPTPVAPSGTYLGNVTGVKLDPKHACVIWSVALDGNKDAFCNDGETSVDGIALDYRNFLPKANDKNEMNKRGISKFQSKINMLQYFSDAMHINMNTLPQIIESIQNAEWIGLRVAAEVIIDSYQGRANNKINRMAAADE